MGWMWCLGRSQQGRQAGCAQAGRAIAPQEMIIAQRSTAPTDGHRIDAKWLALLGGLQRHRLGKGRSGRAHHGCVGGGR
jgi:hypothetical protein